jgi:hypothetical protein
MVDNTPFVASTDPAAPKIADDEVSYQGDLAKVQLIQLGVVTGIEGAHALTKIPGDSVFTQSVVVGASIPVDGIDLFGIKNWGFYVPAEFDGTQIFFQTAPTLTGTYMDVYDITNTRVVMTVATNRYYDVPGELLAVRFLKICTITNQATTPTVFTVQGKGV